MKAHRCDEVSLPTRRRRHGVMAVLLLVTAVAALWTAPARADTVSFLWNGEIDGFPGFTAQGVATFTLSGDGTMVTLNLENTSSDTLIVQGHNLSGLTWDFDHAGIKLDAVWARIAPGSQLRNRANSPAGKSAAGIVVARSAMHRRCR